MRAYDALKAAIIAKKCVTFRQGGHTRHASPHAIGRDNSGDVNVMTFQYGGGSTSKLPSGGQWRCFRVSEISDVKENGDSWHTASDHSRHNTCVTSPDAEVR